MNEHLQNICDSVLNSEVDETAGYVEAASKAQLESGVTFTDPPGLKYSALA